MPLTSGVRYVNYLLPGILLITVPSGIAYTAYRLFTDVPGGIFERFQSMPIARSAALWGHVLERIDPATDDRERRHYRTSRLLSCAAAASAPPRRTAR